MKTPQEDKDEIADNETITVKQKLSISIPFLFGKYSASVELKNLEIPKTKNSFKEMLQKFKDKNFSLK